VNCSRCKLGGSKDTHSFNLVDSKLSSVLGDSKPDFKLDISSSKNCSQSMVGLCWYHNTSQNMDFHDSTLRGIAEAEFASQNL